MNKNEMRALVLKGINEYSVETVSVPTPGPGEVLCAVDAVAICGSDPSIIRGEQAGVFLISNISTSMLERFDLALSFSL